MFNMPNSLLGGLGGYQIIEDNNMVDLKNPQYHEQRRTWKERLFTLPWQPFKKTKIITTYPPLKDYYLIGNRLVGHPVAIRELKRAITA